MRRAFNKSILPKDPPKKGSHLVKRQKYQKKSAMIRALLWDWRRQAGPEFRPEDFAKAIGVHRATIKRYFYGYVPHKDLHWPIARYFASWNEHDAKVLYDDLRATWMEHRLK